MRLSGGSTVTWKLREIWSASDYLRPSPLNTAPLPKWYEGFGGTLCDLGCFTQDGKDSNKYYHSAVLSKLFACSCLAWASNHCISGDQLRSIRLPHR